MKILIWIAAYIAAGLVSGLIVQYIDARQRSLDAGRIVFEVMDFGDWVWSVLGWPLFLVAGLVLGTSTFWTKLYVWVLTRDLSAELIRRELTRSK